MTDDRAHARNTDPDTSHEAADAASVEIRNKRAVVAEYADRRGPAGFMDAQMSQDLGDEGSTLRTRRSELTAQNIILDSGRRGRWGDSDRERIIWVHRNHVANPPPVLDADLIALGRQAERENRQEIDAMAREMDAIARQFRTEGRSYVCERLEACALLLRRLAR